MVRLAVRSVSEEEREKHRMSELEKMHTGELYDPQDPAITEQQIKAMELLYDYNRTRPSEGEKRQAMLRKMFAQVGENCWIEPPFHANWAGRFARLGNNVYANFNLTLVDDTEITIGDCTMIGPNVTIAAAGHPLDSTLRGHGLQYNLPVRIGANCWLGAGVLVMPGVTIGDCTVVGAGSVVTRDLPSGVLAYGNPCRVIRPISEEDRVFYRKGCRVPEELLNRYGL